MDRICRRLFLLGLTTFGAAELVAFSVAADVPLDLEFMLHARFFSDETRQPAPLDPQVFVADEAAQGGIGPQGIQHESGLRPARFSDPGTAPLHNAHGRPLGFNLADWFAARGTARVRQAVAGEMATCRFSFLRPHGLYSLFENHFDQKPIGFTPLDGTAAHNSFRADGAGSAHVELSVARALTHENALLLVYHSDDATHGMSRGAIGVTAHHQLIAPIPG